MAYFIKPGWIGQWLEKFDGPKVSKEPEGPEEMGMWKSVIGEGNTCHDGYFALR